MAPADFLLQQINALGDRGHGWLEHKPMEKWAITSWLVRVVDAQGAGKLLALDPQAVEWVPPPEGAALLHALSPELLAMLAEHILSPSAWPPPQPPPPAAAVVPPPFNVAVKKGAKSLHAFLTTCKHVHRCLTRQAMDLRVEAGVRLLPYARPRLPACHPRAHLRHLERSAHSALEFVALSVAMTTGAMSPENQQPGCARHAKLHDALTTGFAELGFRENAFLARVLEGRALALQHTHADSECRLHFLVLGGGAVVSVADDLGDPADWYYVRPAGEHDQRQRPLGAALSLAPDADDPRVTALERGKQKWHTCQRGCGNRHWAAFVGTADTPEQIGTGGIASKGQPFWVALYDLRTGKQLCSFETAALKWVGEVWMHVTEDGRTLELFMLQNQAREHDDADVWQLKSDLEIARRNWSIDAQGQLSRRTEDDVTIPVHLGDEPKLGKSWRYVVPGEVPEFPQANANGTVTVRDCCASGQSGSVVLTVDGVVFMDHFGSDSSSQIFNLRRVIIVDRALKEHHIRHMCRFGEQCTQPTASLSPDGETVVFVNKWTPETAHIHHAGSQPFVEIHKRRALTGKFGMCAQYDLSRQRLKTHAFDERKLGTFSPCGRFFLLLFQNGTFGMIDIDLCSCANNTLSFRVLCTPAPTRYPHLGLFSKLQWNDSGIWVERFVERQRDEFQTTVTVVQNLSLY